MEWSEVSSTLQLDQPSLPVVMTSELDSGTAKPQQTERVRVEECK